MQIGILGTGQVGRRIGTALVQGGHAVCLGGRTDESEAGVAWAAEHGASACTASFATTAESAEVVLLCVGGQHALAVLEAAGAGLGGKILIDVSNPLDFSKGFPPSLSVCNTESLAEQIQAAHPDVRVVKGLNTVANHLMVDPGSLAGGDHTLLICGDDAEAKAQVSAWMGEWFGWSDIVDVGPVSCARGTEAWLLLWTRLYAAFGDANFNLKLVRA